MRKLFLILSILIIVPFSVTILPWFVCPVLNDAKAYYLKIKLASDALPQNTKIIESISGSGNTTGTSNHTEIWAGILIKSELPEDSIYNFYDKNVQKVTDKQKRTFIMSLLRKEFSSLKTISDCDGYYIVERIDNAVSSYFDIRGH